MGEDTNPFRHASREAQRQVRADETVVAEVETVSDDETVVAVSKKGSDDKYPARLPAENAVPPVGSTVLIDTASNGQPYVDKTISTPSGTSLGGDDDSSIFTTVYEGAGKTARSQLADYPISIEDNSIIYYNGYVYSFGGQDSNNNVIDSVYRYDVAADSWESRTSLPTAMLDVGLAEHNGLIYITGGGDGNNNSLDTVYSYDPSNDSYTTLTSMSNNNDAHASVAQNGFVYTFSGSEEHTQIYDISADSWSVGTTMPNTAQNDSAVIYNGGIHVLATEDRIVYLYDETADSWSTFTNSVPVFDGSITVLNGALYYGTGNSSMYKYNANKDDFELEAGFIQSANERPMASSSDIAYVIPNEDSNECYSYQGPPPSLHTASEESVYTIDEFYENETFGRSPRLQVAPSSGILHLNAGESVYYDSNKFVRIIKIA